MKVTYQKKPPAEVTWTSVPSRAGQLMMGLSGKNQICRLAFLGKKKNAAILLEWQREWPQTKFNKWPQTKFNKGKSYKQIPRAPLLLVGSSFQQAVWKEMLKIPKGHALTYQEVAKKIGNPRACRAVGTACGANPIPYLVPCHRVVASEGLGGFGGGLPLKKALLQSEGYL